MDKWNDAKTAEQNDRVKHDLGSQDKIEQITEKPLQ
jgi:hypothetical protein